MSALASLSLSSFLSLYSSLTFCDIIEVEEEMLAHVAADLAPAICLLIFVLQIFFLIVISCQSKARWKVKSKES